MSLADEVRTVRQRVAERLSELEPLVREYEELLELAGELGIAEPGSERPAGAGAGSVASAGRTGATARAATGQGNSRPRGRGGRRTGAVARSEAPRQQPGQPDPVTEPGPERDALVIEALRAKPGATIADLASILGVPPTSLYRPVRELTSSGAVVKRGRGLFADS
jgi:uncharacterized membrane protein